MKKPTPGQVIKKILHNVSEYLRQRGFLRMERGRFSRPLAHSTQLIEIHRVEQTMEIYLRHGPILYGWECQCLFYPFSQGIRLRVSPKADEIEGSTQVIVQYLESRVLSVLDRLADENVLGQERMVPTTDRFREVLKDVMAGNGDRQAFEQDRAYWNGQTSRTRHPPRFSCDLKDEQHLPALNVEVFHFSEPDFKDLPLAQKSIARNPDFPLWVLILEMHPISKLQPEGLTKLFGAIDHYQSKGAFVILTCLQPEVLTQLEASNLRIEDGRLAIIPAYEDAMKTARLFSRKLELKELNEKSEKLMKERRAKKPNP